MKLRSPTIISTDVLIIGGGGAGLRAGIEAKGHAATYVDDRHLTLFPGLDKNLGDIRLDLGRFYTSRVLNSEGKPIPGAMAQRRHGPHQVEGQAR